MGTPINPSLITGLGSLDGFIIVSSAPSIAGSPLSQFAEAGATVSLRIQTGGTPSADFWYFNQTNLLSSSTKPVLELTNVQFAQSGAYAVVASNALGAATSAPAMLQIIAPVQRRAVPGIRLTGPVGGMLNIDHAELLWPTPNWTALDSVPLSKSSQYYFDLTLPLPPQRFYRAWQEVNPGVVPSLDVHTAAAIALTGNLGDSLRVDYINQVGPTDAWVTLDTVTLTNMSESYFDILQPAQPPRL